MTHVSLVAIVNDVVCFELLLFSRVFGQWLQIRTLSSFGLRPDRRSGSFSIAMSMLFNEQGSSLRFTESHINSTTDSNCGTVGPSAILSTCSDALGAACRCSFLLLSLGFFGAPSKEIRAQSQKRLSA